MTVPVYDASDVRHVTRYQKISNVKCAQISYEQIHKNTGFSSKALKQHRAENDIKYSLLLAENANRH